MLKRAILSTIFIPALVINPAVTSAQSATQSGVRAYLGAGLGYYRLNDENFLDENESLKDDRDAWKAFGGFEINRVFSLEVGYADFGRTRDGSASMEVDGWTLAGVAALPLSRTFAPYAKVGQLFWDRRREFGPFTRDDDGDDLFYGVGVRFMLTESTDLRLEYDRLALKETDLDMGSANLQFRF